MKTTILKELNLVIPILAYALFFSTTTHASPSIDPRLKPGAENDTTADAVAGQLDFVHNARNMIDGRGFDFSGNISDIVVDKTASPQRIYVTDYNNHRVLAWKSLTAFNTHANADIVIGQADFSSTSCNNGSSPTASTLCYPSGVAVDSAGNLYVADKGNHRVLFYETPFESDKVADDVFGQFGSFTQRDCNSTSESSLCNPIRVTLDSADNLYVSDQSNHRVLEFNTPEAISAIDGSGDTTADRVFGQFDTFNTGSCNINNTTSESTLCNPTGLNVDVRGNLYVADSSNNRILKFTSPLTTDTKADKVYGQPNSFSARDCNNGGVNSKTLCYPTAVIVAPNDTLYISDQNNHRVLGYASGSSTAAKILGQFKATSTRDCNNTNGGTFPYGAANQGNLCNPDGLTVDTASSSQNSPNLYVADTSNHRVLQFKPSIISNTNPVLGIKSGQAANGVLGQYVLNNNLPNAFDDRGFNFSDSNGTGYIILDRSVTPNRVYLAEYNNNRVLAWQDVQTFLNHAPANLVFGQPNAYSRTENNNGISEKTLYAPNDVAVDSLGNLYVADQYNHRVLIYTTPFSTDTVADKVLGQVGSFITRGCNQNGLTANSLCTPVGLAFDSQDNLYVADYDNHRVLKFEQPYKGDSTADKVYGQTGSFTTNACNQGGVTANSLCSPYGLTLDGADNLYVADYRNHRVLEYNKLPANDTTADRVFGQLNNFTTNNCNSVALNADSLCYPRAVAVNRKSEVFIADTNNNRVLKYLAPLTTNRTADRVFGQGNLFNANSNRTASPNTLTTPNDLKFDSNENLYVIDSGNNRILQFLQP